MAGPLMHELLAWQARAGHGRRGFHRQRRRGGAAPARRRRCRHRRAAIALPAICGCPSTAAPPCVTAMSSSISPRRPAASPSAARTRRRSFATAALINLHVFEAARDAGVEKIVALGNLLAYPAGRAAAASRGHRCMTARGRHAHGHRPGQARACSTLRRCITLEFRVERRSTSWRRTPTGRATTSTASGARDPGDDRQVLPRRGPRGLGRRHRRRGISCSSTTSPRACCWPRERLAPPEFVNLASGTEISIAKLVTLIARLGGFKRRIVFDAVEGRRRSAARGVDAALGRAAGFLAARADRRGPAPDHRLVPADARRRPVTRIHPADGAARHRGRRRGGPRLRSIGRLADRVPRNAQLRSQPLRVHRRALLCCRAERDAGLVPRAQGACGIGPDDEVIVPDLTMAASATAVILAGATVVFADIEARTLCLDLDTRRVARSRRGRRR